MIEESENKHLLRKALWYRGIGFVIAFIIALYWLGDPTSAIKHCSSSLVIFTIFYIGFEKHWMQNVAPNYKIIRSEKT